VLRLVLEHLHLFWLSLPSPQGEGHVLAVFVGAVRWALCSSDQTASRRLCYHTCARLLSVSCCMSYL
jgi:hypothetical protein